MFCLRFFKNLFLKYSQLKVKNEYVPVSQPLGLPVQAPGRTAVYSRRRARDHPFLLQALVPILAKIQRGQICSLQGVIEGRDEKDVHVRRRQSLGRGRGLQGSE
jgi:hypothetical protein